MSITTYTELKAAVSKWLSRRADLADVIPDFVALGEARVMRDLRLQRMITSGTLTASAGVATIALPAGWLEFVHIKIAGRTGALDPSSVQVLEADHASTETGAPRKFAVRGNELLLGPTPDTDYSLPASWYASIDPLSDSNATTWLLSTHPGLYLWSALAEAAAFLPGDKRLPTWEAKYAAELAQVEAADEAARFGGGQIHQVAR